MLSVVVMVRKVVELEVFVEDHHLSCPEEEGYDLLFNYTYQYNKTHHSKKQTKSIALVTLRVSSPNTGCLPNIGNGP